MNVFVGALAATMAYMVNPIVGFAVFCLISAFTLLSSRGTLLARWLYLTVLSLPLYTTPILPGLPVLASWTSILLIAISLYLISQKLAFSPMDFYLWLVFGLASVVTVINSNGSVRELYYILQMIVFLLPASIAWLARKNHKIVVDENERDQLLVAMAAAIAATAVGVIIQWLLYTQAGVTLGHIAFFRSRITFDLLVPAYSALSALLSIGLPLGPSLWSRGHRFLGFAIPAVSGLAIILNSSRTGLVAGVIGLALILLFPPRGADKSSNFLLLIPAASLVAWLYTTVRDSSRFQSSSFWAGNGRIETYIEGLNIWTESFSYILFGSGYASYPTMPPHNFALETMVCSGILISVVITVWMFRFVHAVWATPWCYLILTYLISSLFFSGFYNFKPLTILLLVALLSVPQGPRLATAGFAEVSKIGSRMIPVQHG